MTILIVPIKMILIIMIIIMILLMIRTLFKEFDRDYYNSITIDGGFAGRNNNDIEYTIKEDCISTKSFEETRTIYTKSEPLEIFMGSNTEDVIDKLFNTLLQRFQRAQETSNERGSEFIPDSVELLYYHFQRIDIRRAESYIMSPDWILS